MSPPRRAAHYFTSLVLAASIAGALILLWNRPPAAPEPPARASAPAGTRSARAARHAASAPSAKPRQSASAPRRKRAYVIAALGDSLTDKKSHGGGYLSYLKKRCPQSRIDNYGKGADMVNQMRRRFARSVLASGKPRYTHFIVFGGVNDLYSDLTAGRTPQKVAEDLLYMFTRARQRGMQVVALTVAPWGGFRKYYNPRRGQATRELNRWIRDQFDAGTVDWVIDAYALLSCGEPHKLCPAYAKPFRDGIHFGPAGHAALGQALYEQVFKDCL